MAGGALAVVRGVVGRSVGTESRGGACSLGGGFTTVLLVAGTTECVGTTGGSTEIGTDG